MLRLSALPPAGAGKSDARAALMDFASAFFTDLVEFAEAPEFKGQARLIGPAAGTRAIYKLRWQNDLVVPNEEQPLPVFLPEGSGQRLINPDFFNDLLATPAVSSAPPDPVKLDTARRGRLAKLPNWKRYRWRG